MFTQGSAMGGETWHAPRCRAWQITV